MATIINVRSSGSRQNSDKAGSQKKMSNHARTGEALADMLQRTLYEFEDGTNDDPDTRAGYSPNERLPSKVER
jgi:hypothetical protein